MHGDAWRETSGLGGCRAGRVGIGLDLVSYANCDGQQACSRLQLLQATSREPAAQHSISGYAGGTSQ